MAWYSQNDPRWKDSRLGLADGITIGADGCYITAETNLANDCGHDIDVAALDQIYTDNAGGWGYADQDLVIDGSLSNVYPDIVYQGAQNYDGPADLSQLNNDVHVKQILEVDGQPSNPGLQTHFVYFYDYVDGIVRVIDSWTGLLINLADVYGDPATCIYKIITYTWNPPQTPPPPVDPAPVLPPPHTDPTPPPAPEPAPVEPPVEPAPTPDIPVEPVITVTPVPPADPAPTIAPEAPIDKFLKWLFNLIFFWAKGK